MSVHRPDIEPVPHGGARPMWSVMIPTFNCAAELRVTLASVLAQDPGEDVMQIEVVDDCSTADDPESVVREVGGGRVAFHRQPRNVGHVENFNTCLARSRGRLVHLLHGDDLVLDGFYAGLGGALQDHPEAGAAFCRHALVDDDGRTIALAPSMAERSGVLHGWLDAIAVRQLVQPPAMVVRRAVYEGLGGFDRRIRAYGEDWEMWVRVAAAHPVWYEARTLAAYRVRRRSLSGGAIRSGQNVRDFRTAIAINHAVLPPDAAARISRRARRETALSALRKAGRIAWAGDRRTPLVQLREALRTSRSPAVGARAALLLAHWLAAGVAGRLGLLPPPR